MKRYVFLACTLSTSFITTQSTEELSPLSPTIYDTYVDNDEIKPLEDTQQVRKPKGYLSVEYLDVNQALTVNGYPVTANPAVSSGAFLTSYGQLTFASEQNINFTAIDEWTPIPFNTAGPASGMNVSTTSPATITVTNSGAYQLTASLYFSVADSIEATFEQTTYTLGLTINGVTTPVTSVYIGAPEYCSLNYTILKELSANDEIQWHMEVSDLGSYDGFRNIVSLINGGAYALQISN